MNKGIYIIPIIAVIALGILVFFIFSGDKSKQEELSFTGESYAFQIPANALPKSISQDEVSVEELSPDNFPESVQNLNPEKVYRLEPDGLELKKPVEFSIEIPMEEDDFPALYHISDEGPELIQEITITPNFETKTATLEGKIQHFSILGLISRLDSEIAFKTPGAEYLRECRSAIEKMERFCITQHDNWSLDVAVVRNDWTSEENARYNNFEFEEYVLGPYNECLGTGAGDYYPLYIKSQSLDAQKGKKVDDEITESYEVWCSIACFGWSCPAEDIIEGGPVDEAEEPSEPLPEPTPEPEPTPPPPPPTPKACNFEEFVACRDEFDLVGCIESCPFLPSVCPPGTEANATCAETDPACVDECFKISTPHAEECAEKASCTKEEIGEKLRELDPEL
ncbi:hypothetical protein CL629_01725 [bacterium]|nr:hypothetical protein [bacterium]|tara:strand:+ start:1129 stop:2316 length:1188 start_codon:yes stop_codon:yes gene_type:complete